MRTAGLEDTGLGVKIGGRVINNLRYADDTTIIAEDPKDLKLLMNKIIHASAGVGLELNLAKIKVMTTGKNQIFKLNG
jgi:Reverse transcriptase (RNA-dependent DNA polymerase).